MDVSGVVPFASLCEHVAIISSVLLGEQKKGVNSLDGTVCEGMCKAAVSGAAGGGSGPQLLAMLL